MTNHLDEKLGPKCSVPIVPAGRWRDDLDQDALEHAFTKGHVPFSWDRSGTPSVHIGQAVAYLAGRIGAAPEITLGGAAGELLDQMVAGGAVADLKTSLDALSIVSDRSVAMSLRLTWADSAVVEDLFGDALKAIVDIKQTQLCLSVRNLCRQQADD